MDLTTTAPPLARRALQHAGLALLGFVVGVVAKLADNSDVNWASDLGTYPAVWILALAAIARFAPSFVQAALRSTTFFLAMSLGYYAWSVFVLQFGIGNYLFLWGGMSVTAVPAAAAGLWWASRYPGLLPGLGMAMAAGLALSDGTLTQLWWRSTGSLPDDFPVRPVQAMADAVLALAIVGLLPLHRATRLWALLFLPPTAWLMAQAVEGFYGTFIR